MCAWFKAWFLQGVVDSKFVWVKRSLVHGWHGAKFAWLKVVWFDECFIHQMFALLELCLSKCLLYSVGLSLCCVVGPLLMFCFDGVSHY